MWFHLTELWRSSRILQLAVIAAAVGLIVALTMQPTSTVTPTDPAGQVINQASKGVGQIVKSATGVPIAPPIPGQVNGTMDRAAGVAGKAVDVAGDAVSVAGTVVDVGGKVVDAGADVVNRFLSDPAPKVQGTTAPNAGGVTPPSP